MAEKFTVKPITVREWLRNGVLTGHKIGRIWRISDEDIGEMLAKTECKAPT